MTTYSIALNFKIFNFLLQLIHFFYKKGPITITLAIIVDYYDVLFNLKFIFFDQKKTSI